MSTTVIYSLSAAILFALAVAGLFALRSPLKRVLALNVMSSSVFMVLIAGAYEGPDRPADPVPHALVLTGIVVAVSMTALALVLISRIHHKKNTRIGS